jgi:hypothetical protein
MPKVKWKDLPPQLRQNLFDRAKERKISMEDLFAWKNGVRILQTFQRACGTRISDLSISVEKVNTQRLSFCGVSPRMARRLSRAIRFSSAAALRRNPERRR